MSSSAKNIRPAGAGEPLDAIDERLLGALVADARISNKQLAELVGIAPSTALMRTRALSERGIIQGFEAKQFLVMAWAFPHGYGVPLPWVYPIWLGVVALLYPFCRWVASVKARRKDWWLSYL